MARFTCARCLRHKFNHVPQPHKEGHRGASNNRCKGPFMRISESFDIKEYLRWKTEKEFWEIITSQEEIV